MATRRVSSVESRELVGAHVFCTAPTKLPPPVARTLSCLVCVRSRDYLVQVWAGYMGFESDALLRSPSQGMQVPPSLAKLPGQALRFLLHMFALPCACSHTTSRSRCHRSARCQNKSDEEDELGGCFMRRMMDFISSSCCRSCAAMTSSFCSFLIGC